MPVYVYQCQDCKMKFEERGKFDDLPETECPSCGGKARRVIQPVGHFQKRKGWQREKQQDGSTIYSQ